MATLFDVTLDLARHARGVKRYKVSQISDDGLTFSSPTMKNIAGEYVNGTVWIMTGDNAGEFARIKRAVNQKVTMEDDAPTVAVGDTVMICPWIDFDLDELIEAINSVLYHYPILAVNTDLTWNSNTLAYDLPEGVSDIRRVAVSNTLDTFTDSHCWLEEAGQLRFHTAQGLYADGGTIQIKYRKLHGEVYEAKDEIDPTVDLTYLRNMAFLYLWRQVIIVQHKDNPVASDMFNEAKMYEADHTKFNIPERNIPMRSFFTR